MPKLIAPKCVYSLWHYRVEDNGNWRFCEGILEQNYGYDAKGAKEAVARFKSFFKDVVGHSVYVKCPECGTGKTKPVNGSYGLFIGCSNFPGCKFLKQNRPQFYL